jgi:hypothetical protein
MAVALGVCAVLAMTPTIGMTPMAKRLHYFTFSEWLAHTVNKIVTLSLSAPEEHREDYMRVQIEAAIRQALRHGRSGRSDDDPVTP